MTLDGVSSVTVAPGATVSAAVNVTTNSTGTSTRWRCTGWRIATTGPGTVTYEDHPNHDAVGTYTETFGITAPASAGTYNAYFIAYSNDGCSSNASSTYTMASAVIVVAPPSVSSINWASANPTAPATPVSWAVTFSNSVTGVDASDFVLASVGVMGASISSVTGSGTTWTVTANTGSGGGTLGLNLVDNDSIIAGSTPLGGPGAGNGNFTGQIYTVTAPFSCTQPANTPGGLSLTCVCDTFVRASLNPSTIFNSNWIVSTSDATGISPSIVNSGYLRLTNNTANNAKAATVPGIFPATGNYISVEFQQYAYNGSGADGIAVTLSDYSVPAVPGAFGGSLGYAQRTGVVGFAGGWLGVALDEYGNYQNPTEGRLGGPGFRVDSVGMRGSGAGMAGYNWLGGTATLTPQIDNNASTTPALGYYYQVIVDARNEPTSTAVAVNRDTGAGYTSLISIPNVYTAATAQGFTQSPVPTNWQISFTGSTGGSTNIHEISGLRICAQTVWPPTGGTASGFSAIDEAYPTAANAIPAYQNFQTGHIYMKLPGAANTFKLWVAALTGTGISGGYSAISAKYVKVNLVDNSDNACGPDSARTCNSTCTNKPAVETGAAQTVIFALSGPGASLSPSFTLNSSWKSLVAIMKECTTSACTAFTATNPACSADSFSVRPTGVSSVTSSDAIYAGTIIGPPIVKAGSNFSLTATIPGAAGAPVGTLNGYTGNLKVNNATLQLIAPATVFGAVASTLPPARFPAATSGTPTSSATGNFTYSEVGAFQLPGYDPAADTTSPRGVFDSVATASECTAPGLTSAQCDVLRASTWTGVDSISTKGDCILDSYRNTRDTSGTFSTNTNYGKFGCGFGLTTTTAGFGRFVPDHFTLISAQTRQRNDITPGYAATRETTGTIVAGTAVLIVADTTDFSVGDTVVVFGAGAGGKDLIVTITAAAANVLTLSAPAATGVTNTPVFERLGFTYMDEPLQLALSLEARNAAGGKTQNYATATGLAKLDNSSLTGTASNSWGLSGIVNHLYDVADCRALFSSVAPYNTTYSGGGCASLPASVPVAPYAASAARVSPSSTAAVTWTAGATSLTTDITLKRASRPDGAFNFINGTFALGIWPKDGDGITFLSANDGSSLLSAAKSLDTDAVAGADVVAVGVADMRFGRMRFSNAYGSELLDLVLPMEVQYWSWNLNGGTFVRNVLDSHTPLVNTGAGTTNFGLSNYRRSLASGETSLLPASIITFANGAANMRLSRPGAGNSGSVRVCADLDAVAGVGDTTCQAAGGVANKPYLQGGAGFNIDPSADIAFGTHKSGPVIYLREGY